MARARHILPAVLVAGLSLVTSACAGTTYNQRYPVYDRDNRTYYDGGFRDGRNSGIDDARRGRSVRRDSSRRIPRQPPGHHQGDLPAFRSGFEAGYDEGYRLYARQSAKSATHRHPPIRIRLHRPRVIRVRKRRLMAPTADATRPGGDNGYRDGFEEGNTRRSTATASTVGEKRYRDGDHDYKKQYGSRDEVQARIPCSVPAGIQRRISGLLTGNDASAGTPAGRALCRTRLRCVAICWTLTFSGRESPTATPAAPVSLVRDQTEKPPDAVDEPLRRFRRCGRSALRTRLIQFSLAARDGGADLLHRCRIREHELLEVVGRDFEHFRNRRSCARWRSEGLRSAATSHRRIRPQQSAPLHGRPVR